MAKIKLLIDTDILIDHLKGIKPAKELFDHNINVKIQQADRELVF
jgi:hypothetical protein